MAELAKTMRPPVGKMMALLYVRALEKMKLLERNSHGRIISVATEVPHDIQWISFPLSPSSHVRRNTVKRPRSKK